MTVRRAWAGIVAIVLCIYLPGIGRGFVQDDFAWILQAQGGAADVASRAFTTSLGFYRPLVTLSFALDRWLFGLAPLGYGLTNLALALACMALIARLGRRLGLPDGAALAAAALWILNFHGINMAVLWISGRTSLLATLFAVLAAIAFERRRIWPAAAWTLLALLSKEEAATLPLILAAWSYVGSGSSYVGSGFSRTVSRDPCGLAEAGPRVLRDGPTMRSGLRAMREAWPLAIALAIYALLRLPSGAFTPATAPDFYRFTTDPWHLATNAAEYAVRAGLTAGLAVLVLAAAAGRWPRLDEPGRRIAVKGLIWALGGFAITVWLPVRSSLYAVYPSVGVALVAGSCAAVLGRGLAPARRPRLVLALVVALLLLLPVYWTRNQRWVELADVSAATLAHVRGRLARLGDGTVIALTDDGAGRASFENAFGGLLPEASRLFLERNIRMQLAPPANGPHLDVRRSQIGL